MHKVPPRTPSTYPDVAVSWVSHPNPTDVRPSPTNSNRDGPTRPRILPAVCAPAMIATLIGRYSSPALSRLEPWTSCRYSDRKYHMEKNTTPISNITTLAVLTDRDR